MSLFSLVNLSLQSLDSLVSAISNFGAGVSSAGPTERQSPLVQFFEFLRVASTSGLKQYPSEITEEGLAVAKLGDGTDYVVHKVRISDGDVVVVKHAKATLQLDGTEGSSESGNRSRLRKVLHEIKIATHPMLRKDRNILQMKGFGWELAECSLTTPFIVVEYAEHGTLRDYLQRTAVNKETKLSLAFDLARALQVLHTQCIAHGDLKLENALVSIVPQDPTLRLTDFGLSVVLNDEERSYEYWGTQQYRPPEVYQQTGDSPTAGLVVGSKYRACDIYAYGLVVLEVLIDGKRYAESASEQGEIEERDKALKCLSGMSDTNVTALNTLRTIAEKCLNIEVEARPPIEGIVSQLDRLNKRGDEEEDMTPLTFSELVSSNDISSVLDLNHMIAPLIGRDIDEDSIQLAPWNVQELVCEGFRQRTNHHDLAIASRACLELGICHYLGFGVERDQKKVLQYIDQAAATGRFQARRIRHRLYEAFLQPIEPLNIVVGADDQEERQLRRLLAAESQNAEVNPFQLFDEVTQEDVRSQLDGSDITLHQAAYIGNISRIQNLLREMRDFQDDQGRTALLLATQGHHLDAIELLLGLGSSDPSLPDEDGHTALHMLIMLSSVEIEVALSLMLRFSPGLDLDAFSSSPLDASEHWAELWGAPIHWAVLAGNKAMALALVRAGARVHDWPEHSCPVRIAASLHLSDILDILLSAISPGVSLQGSNPLFQLNSSNPFRRLLLHGKDYVEQMKKTVALLAKRYPIIDEQEGEWHGNPLRKVLAVNFSASDCDIAKALVSVGADEDKYEGLTLLQTAIIGCRGSPLSSICRMALDLIETQQDFRLRSTDHRPGWAALHWAAAADVLPMAEMLLQVDPESINLRTQEDEDRTPLHLAAEAGKSVTMINLLLEHGADASLTTRGLKLTPLGSFIGKQRSGLGNDILTALLDASKKSGYLAFSSDKWNVLHFAATRSAIPDVESLPGHLLLRTLATMPEMKSLIESITTQGWTPLQLASYFVDYTTIKLLVEEFNADVQAKTPQNATAFDIVLERARQFHKGLRGADSLARWSRLSYRSALYLQEKLEAIEGPYHLTKLHIATYMGYYEEVVRLVLRDSKAVLETNWEGETPRQMLQNTMPVNVSAEWASRFCSVAEGVCKYLESKEFELKKS